MNKWIIFAGLKVFELVCIPLIWYVFCHIGQWMYAHGYSFMDWGNFWLHGITFIFTISVVGMAILILVVFIGGNISLAEKLKNRMEE